MRDYAELIEALRCCSKIDARNNGCDSCPYEYCGDDCQNLCGYAADAIEELLAKVPQWIMIESRPMDKEEREYYSERYDFPLNEDEAVIYCCPLPEHGQEVLVLNRYGRIWLDTFDDDPDYGVGFETNGDMDGIVAWMPLPEPPKGVE